MPEKKFGGEGHYGPGGQEQNTRPSSLRSGQEAHRSMASAVTVLMASHSSPSSLV